LLARYLIESSDDDAVVILDLHRTQDWGVVKSVFKRVVGNYHSMSEEEENLVANTVHEIVHKNQDSLKK